jgi:uncharacterized protein (DUF1501 family)
MIARRSVLKGGLAGLALSAIPQIAYARALGERRFVFIIQRGAADGLHLVPPLGDPGFESLRGRLMSSLQGAHACDSTFSLHPVLEETARLFGQGRVIACHAVATGYRARSHFDGQNILETGARRAYEDKTGWLNRLIRLLPAAESNALAVSAAIPMALRGQNPVSSYAPTTFESENDALMMEVSTLYGGDPQLAGLWDRAMATRGLVGDSAGDRGKRAGADIGGVAAKLLAPADGARVMMIETTGWDMHARLEARAKARVGELDALIGALVQGLGPAWPHTLVLVATEFGRTAAVNGTSGTDHGTGSAALLLGGSLDGGRVLSEWPGLAPKALFEGRDLRPTMALEALVSGAVARHFDLDPALVARTLYPAIGDLSPVAL